MEIEKINNIQKTFNKETQKLERFIDLKKYKIKNCPFCGGKANLRIIEKLPYRDNNVFVTINCNSFDCLAFMTEQANKESEFYEREIEQVVKNWNRRVKNGNSTDSANCDSCDK